MCIDFDKALASARLAASRAKDGDVRIGGTLYRLTYNKEHWHYVVMDSQNRFIVNLNVKTLTRAKSELRTWLAS